MKYLIILLLVISCSGSRCFTQCESENSCEVHYRGEADFDHSNLVHLSSEDANKFCLSFNGVRK